MYRELKLVSPQELLEIYYSSVTGEVGGNVIKSLFVGGISNSTLHKIKEAVYKEMREQNIPQFRPHRVNLGCLFDYLGIDVENLERLNKKLKKLKNSQT